MKEYKALKAIAEKVVERNVNSACIFWVYQPKIPTKAINRFKK